MNIGVKIRSYRHENEITQEVLAELLGVSVSAVSLWESGKTMPDISLIPAICSVLNITADELLDVNLERKKIDIMNILSEAKRYSFSGYNEKAFEIIEEGLSKYPDSYQLMQEQVHIHYRLFKNSKSAEEKRIHIEKAIEYGERIIENCTDSRLKVPVVQQLCYIYKNENTKRAEELLETLGSIYVSQEVMATHIYEGSKKLNATCSLMMTSLDILTRRMKSNVIDDDGHFRYTKEEEAKINEKVIAIYNQVFDEGDFGFYHTRLFDSEFALAEYYAEIKNEEKTVYHIEKAAYHAIEFVKYAECSGYVYDSLAVRGMKCGGVNASDSKNEAKKMLCSIEAEKYDFIRENEEFKNILVLLDEYSGDWKVSEII